MAETQAVTVNSQNFTDVVEAGSYHRPILVEFWATWCATCRAFEPIVEKITAEMDGTFVLAKLEFSENGKLFRRFSVRGVPAFKIFRSGKVVDEFDGELSESELRKFIEQNLNR